MIDSDALTFVVGENSKLYHTIYPGGHTFMACGRRIEWASIRIHGKGAEQWLKANGYRSCKRCPRSVAAYKKRVSDNGR